MRVMNLQALRLGLFARMRAIFGPLRRIPPRGARATRNREDASFLRRAMLGVVGLLLLAHQTACGQGPSVSEASLTWYGVYQTRDDKAVADASTLDGSRVVSKGIVPPRSNSDRIPAILDTRFGFGFTLSGRPVGALVNLHMVRNFPAVGAVSGKTGERHVREEGDLTLGIGQTDLFIGYLFSHDYELVPGIWSFEIWQDNRKLLEKSFNVYIPT
jgi:hypothetical protein